MKIVSADFIISAARPEQYPNDSLPEVAFAGRSNVGKSSLINRLVQRRKLVRVSNTPGRTQIINFFLVNRVLRLVDLPGYGYAKVSREVKAGWEPMMRAYLGQRANLKLVVHILDARHEPTPLDMEFSAWLAGQGKPSVLVATKWDKLKPSHHHATIKMLAGALPAGARPIPFSAETGLGRDELWGEIIQATGMEIAPSH